MGENKLPENWVETTLGEVLNVFRGASPRPKGNPKYFGGDIPWVKISDISKIPGKFVYETKDHVTEEGAKKSRLLSKGSLIVSNSGTVGIPKFLGVDACIHDGFLGFPNFPEKHISKDFIYYFFLGIRQKLIAENQQGVTQVNLNTEIVRNIKFTLPPLPEQKRMVAKLDQLFAHLEGLKARLDKIPALLKDFRQAVLTQAVTGKLTEEWREGKELTKIDLQQCETTREKLKKAEAFARGRKSYKHKKAVLPEVGGRSKGIKSLFKLPSKWQWASLDQIVWNISDGPHFSPKYVTGNDGKRFISMRNISFNKLDFAGCKFVSQDDHLEFIKRGKPEEGDILYTKGGTTGIPCVIKSDTDFSYWVHVALLKPISDIINSYYLTNALMSPICYNQSQALTHGVGNQDLGLTRMIFIALPLPPLEEQKEIVRRVDALFAKADAIEQGYERLKTQIEQLPQAILAKAFKGELVPQLPSDGDAQALLEEIKQLKEAAAQAKKKSKKKPRTKKA